MSSPVDLALLPDHLRSQRWFGGKAWPIRDVAVLDHVVVPRAGREPFVLAVVEVTYELGAPEWYALPVLQDGGLHDAMEDDDTARALYTLIRSGSQVKGATGVLVGEPIPVDGRVLPEPGAVRRLQVEQSNTSVVLGEQVILKVIRKLQPGTNPEFEVGRFLATRTRFRAMPAFLGALHLESQGGLTVALLHEFVPRTTDGWKYTVAAFERSRTPDAALLGEFGALGRVVGELHVALASDPQDPAFAPEPVQVDDLQRWSSSIIGEMGVTLAQASSVDPTLFRKREPLIERLKRLAHVPPGGQRMRVHGDLHLGQVLRQDTRWLIFDFEGEPARTFQQRREKTTPLKDVAGMLRSFDYAAATVGMKGTERRALVEAARGAFLGGYRDATRGAAFLPGEEETFDTLLDAFELEKTLYEVRYELQNRPDWVHIPLEALMRAEGDPQ
ncbi:MAG: phosphotransferase [Myxococcaceae bacterium]|nr:phosphotransferase [Myxococcaceae bacterium]MCI0669180.1 phosphotransferase [Myxococcaceae bacterium]